MIKGFKIALILLLCSHSVFSQRDSMKSQILNYEDSKSMLITKGRKLLLDKFMEGDLQKVKEIKDYLVTTEDNDYFALYPAEYWFILYWTGDYAELANQFQQLDSARVAGYDRKINPVEDLLFVKLKEKSTEHQLELKKQLQEASLDQETSQVLNLSLDWLLLKDRNGSNGQDSLNRQADHLLQSTGSGKYDEFTKRFIRYKLEPKKWGIACEFFSGYGQFTGQLSESFTNNVPFGVAFDICYKNFELYLRDYIGINKTNRDFNYPSGTWEKGSKTNVFLPEATLGYVTYNDNRFKLSPFAGIASMDISPPTNAKTEKPELKNAGLEFTTTYVLGINFDLKFGPGHTPEYSPKTSYGFIRIRYAYCMPQFANNYAGMTGNMHYLTIGIGAMARGLERAY